MEITSQRIARLPKDHRGFPVPWFVQWFDQGKMSDVGVGQPDFRVVDGSKISVALRQRRCWICGETLGVHKAFLIGPMCAVNRVISEPPSHRECAEFSAKVCPFLSRPRMRRNEKDLPDDKTEAAGFAIKRNPGVVCLWITRTFKPFRPDVGQPGVLFRIGEPEEVVWFAEGRIATRAEVLASIDSGFPILMEQAQAEGPKAIDALGVMRRRAEIFLPQMESAA